MNLGGRFPIADNVFWRLAAAGVACFSPQAPGE